ncbi:MAG: tripartite tricarboxylate transporter substrate binding protein BugD [Rhizobiales bacterium]|nr:tripartite tricarboxylate transporter substrate binding protein BugD [Hyphomicrobiales bacterium]
MESRSMRWRCAIVAVAALCSAVQAQDWPSKPVTVVVAAATGGPIDVFALIMADRMSANLGQRVLVENAGGSGGIVGGKRVAKAKPDGYTLLLGTIATHANPQLLADKPPYDPVDDFAPIALIAEIPLVLVARKNLPANTFEEFAAYAKKNQAGMTFGSAGVGSASHLGCVMLQRAMGVTIRHLPYRGTAPAMQDLIAGRLDFLCEIAVTAVPNIEAGSVKALANLSEQRSAVLPDLPTAGEKGLPAVQAYTWTALFSPKRTPAPIVAKLQAATVMAMNGPGLREQLDSLAATLVAPERRSSEYLGRFVRSEFDKWGEAIRTGGALPK